MPRNYRKPSIQAAIQRTTKKTTRNYNIVVYEYFENYDIVM